MEAKFFTKNRIRKIIIWLITTFLAWVFREFLTKLNTNNRIMEFIIRYGTGIILLIAIGGLASMLVYWRVKDYFFRINNAINHIALIQKYHDFFIEQNGLYSVYSDQIPLLNKRFTPEELSYLRSKGILKKESEYKVQ